MKHAWGCCQLQAMTALPSLTIPFPMFHLLDPVCSATDRGS